MACARLLALSEKELELLKQALGSLDDGMRISLNEEGLEIWNKLQTKIKWI